MAQRDDCLNAERRAARDYWLWEAVGEVTRSLSGSSVKARETVAKHTAKVERRLQDRCGGRAPAAFTQFSNDIQPVIATGRFGNRQLDQVLRAWLRWGSAVGAPEAASREIRVLASCRRFFPRFDASYRIWWKWTETGKAWWLQITFDNRTGKSVGGSMGGTAKVTNVLEDPFGWARGPKAGPGKDAILRWGGSSADFVVLKPGRTVQDVAPDADLDVHTTAEGTFRVSEIDGRPVPGPCALLVLPSRAPGAMTTAPRPRIVLGIHYELLR